MKRFIALLSSLIYLFLYEIGFARVSAEQVIEKVDNIRNPGESYFMRVVVTNPLASDASTFEVSIQGNNKTLIKTLEPPRDRGRNLLMLNEEMWVFIPNLKRAVRVSLSQKLTGQAANGDISRMRWSGDYTASFLSQTNKQWKILLIAKKKGLTYEKVKVWVVKQSFHPTHAEFLTANDKIIKKVAFSEYKLLVGQVRPTQIAIQDAIRKDDRSIIKIISMDVRSFPASLFNQNSLK